MGRKIDLTGQRFGKWTALRESKKRDNQGKILWECLCDCGNTSLVRGANLRNGQSTSCGCNWSVDLTGKRFGKLTVVKKSRNTDKWDGTIWVCRCDCGLVKEVKRKYLINGESKSCGNHNHIDLSGERFGRWEVLGPVRGKDAHNRKIWKCRCECGSIENVPGTILITNQSKSCGCFRVDRMRSQTGVNSPVYNPNLTDEERMKNRYQLHGLTLTLWRREIYVADNYTCQGCGENSGGKLNAHHLNAWNAFPEQRFDTANGITLCEDCHKEFHHFNGYGDNTFEQFRDHIACTVGEEHISEIEETLLSRESEIIGQEQPTRELQTT